MKKTAFPDFIEINLMKYEDNGNKIYILLILLLFNNAQIDILMILMHYMYNKLFISFEQIDDFDIRLNRQIYISFFL